MEETSHGYLRKGYSHIHSPTSHYFSLLQDMSCIILGKFQVDIQYNLALVTQLCPVLCFALIFPSLTRSLYLLSCGLQCCPSLSCLHSRCHPWDCSSTTSGPWPSQIFPNPVTPTFPSFYILFAFGINDLLVHCLSESDIYEFFGMTLFRNSFKLFFKL